VIDCADASACGAVLAAVHHAEVVAHRVGEPYGSLVLAVAVTVIEVALIVTLMIAGASAAETLARDTVFAAVILTLNGIVGLSIVAGTRVGSVVSFNAEGSGAALATVADGHAAPPSARAALISVALLIVSLVDVVGDAKLVSPTIERGVVAAGFATSVVGDHRDADPVARDIRSVTHIVLFTLTCVVTVLTVVPGRATLLRAGVHLALLGAYLFLAIYP
jgi:Ca2+/H+ antiporter